MYHCYLCEVLTEVFVVGGAVNVGLLAMKQAIFQII